jgi:RHS repeat-associated protein
LGQKVLLDGIEEAREYGPNVMRYDHDPSRVDGLLAQKTSAGKGYFVSDALGSVYGVVDGNGTEVSKYGYDVYGARTAGSEGMATTWGFTGRAGDATGMQYNRARFMDPMGMVDGPNVYQYARGQPLDHRDPLGLYTILFVGDLIPLSIYDDRSMKGIPQVREIRPTDHEGAIVGALAARRIIPPNGEIIEMANIRMASQIVTELQSRGGLISSDGHLNVVYVGHSIQHFDLSWALHPSSQGDDISGTEFGRAIKEGLGTRGMRVLGDVTLAACNSATRIGTDVATELKQPIMGVLGLGQFQAHWGILSGEQGPSWTGWVFAGRVQWVAPGK